LRRRQAEPALRLVALIRERLPATLIALGRTVEGDPRPAG